MRLAFWSSDASGTREVGGCHGHPLPIIGVHVTTNDEKSTLCGPLAYEAERRRHVLVRVEWAAMLALGPIALAVPLNLWAFPDTVAPRLVLLGVIGIICMAGLALTRIRAAAAHPDAIAVAFVLAVAVCTGRLILQSPEDLDVFVGVVAASMLTTALFFPWTGRVQLIVSLAIGAGYMWLLSAGSFTTSRIANVMIALFDGIFLSVIGAYTLDQQRRATFEEREQATALAAQREQLLEVGHELNEVLDTPELCRRIVRRGRVLVAADACALVLIDSEQGTVRTAAIDGDPLPAFPQILEREAAASTDHPFFRELSRHSWVEIPSGGPLDRMEPELRERFGVHRLLLVPVRRDAAFIGYLAFVQLRPAPPFTAAQQRLAAGLTQLSAVALANARLVAALQSANQVKSEFVSTMSHELRTPLGVIMGYTEILEDGDPGLRRDAILRIKRSSMELLEMIEETLNLNRLESGRDVPVIEPVAMPAFWDELASELAALPRAAAVVLRFDPVPDGVVATDRRKLRIVVKNLIGNALKFTATGEVVASCRIDADGCTIAVRDTGIGIAARDLPVIFEMFRQADSSDRRAYGGVGLGLHIVQRLVRQLDGRVDVESAPGVGSTFRVVLPPSAIVSARAAA
jgi:signal transduction histidine kinase